MPLTPEQQQRLTDTIAPLYADALFEGVSDILAEVTMTPPPTSSETDSFDVPKPTAPATPAELPAA